MKLTGIITHFDLEDDKVCLFLSEKAELIICLSLFTSRDALKDGALVSVNLTENTAKIIPPEKRKAKTHLQKVKPKN